MTQFHIYLHISVWSFLSVLMAVTQCCACAVRMTKHKNTCIIKLMCKHSTAESKSAQSHPQLCQLYQLNLMPNIVDRSHQNRISCYTVSDIRFGQIK